MADFYMSNVTGLLDVDAIVKSLTMVKQKQIEKLAQEKALLQAKSTSISNLLSALKDLQGFNEGLQIENLFKGKTVSVSDPSVLKAEVAENAPNLSLAIKVKNLSQGEIRITSEGVSNLSYQFGPSNFTLRYWTDTNNYIDTAINFTGGTLEDLVNTINQAQDKVVASVYFDGSSYKLMLAEKEVGASTKETDVINGSYVIEINGNLPSELGSLSTTIQNAQNARIQMGSDSGPEISSPTNTFKNIVSGLTITALKTSDSFVQINIKDSYDKVSQALNNLFSKINGVIDLVNQLTQKNSPFQGNQSITQIKSRLFSLTKPLQALGIVNMDEQGKYSLNTSALDNLIQQGDINKIKTALSDTKKNLQTYLEGLVKTFQKYQETQDNKIKALDQKAQALKLSLVREEEKLRLTFTKIETLMYQNEQLRTRLENFVVSLSEANKKG
ncbi:MAG: flagellar filament capping protein FliD [Caldimicrobium sp.]